MKVVVDTNIFFSATITRNGRLRQALFTNDVEFVAPHFSIVELFKYKDKIELDALLWTGDNKLKNGIKAKGFNRFYEL